MSRLPAALAALLLAAPALGAQDDKKPDQPEVDAKTKAAIQREVEKAKEDIRNEVRAEIQGAQSAAEFLGAVAEGPKLDFLQLDGYLRTRGELKVNFSLTGQPDASNHYLYPVPLQGGRAAHRDSLANANMRFRLEPTLNVSEHVRVRSQLDFFDNYVLGQSSSKLWDGTAGAYTTFYGSSQITTANDSRTDSPAVSPKRAWAEVQTPVGLLSFGRMPSEWGLGMLSHAGGGIDDDYGDTFDRLQFALPPVSTPIGRLTIVPIMDFDSTGPLYRDPHQQSSGVGQPFEAESGTDGRTYALKIARLDTDDEIRRKVERGQSSVNFGVYYNYRSQRYSYPSWNGPTGTGLGCTDGSNQAANGSDPTDATPSTTCGEIDTAIHRAAYAHIGDLWFRRIGPRLRVEGELALVYGSIGNAATDLATATGRVMLRQWGAVLTTDYQVSPNKLRLGLDLGMASGDDAPGFGNVPQRRNTSSSRNQLPTWGSLEGPQYIPGADRSIRNFRFNPAYRVDFILFRHILGQVTDAWYAKPKLRYDILPGLRLDFSMIYSQAMYSQSTPSATGTYVGGQNGDVPVLTGKGHAPLGLEADTQLTYTSGDGFQAWGQWGVLQPLSGFKYTAPDGTTASPSRAHWLAFGVAAKF